MYKVNDLVFYGSDIVGEGVGEVVAKDVDGFFLVHSPTIDGHSGNERHPQDNENNYWFLPDFLKPFEKRVGQRYKFIGRDGEFEDGEIVTLVVIDSDNISLYSSNEYEEFLWDVDRVDRDGDLPDLEYFDEGVDNNRPTLEVGMVIGFELDDGTQSSEMRIIKEYDVKDYQSRTSINRVYKQRENGDLELIWQREQLYTLEGEFTKEETIKIGEHLDWKRVDN